MADAVDEQHLETKFLPVAPPALSLLVARPDLTRRLDAAVRSARLTLVAAPAGFGKTTLLSAWWGLTAPRTCRKAWLSLDRRDQDPVRFWSYLIDGLRRVDARIGARALALLRASPSMPAESMVSSLVNDFVAAEEAFVLVLDDFHLVAESPVVESFKTFLQSAPPNVHVLLASRTEPPLGLARLRAGGQLAEFAIDDLRFNSEEARELLEQATGQHLDADALGTLMARTEGWPAGVRLAGLSLTGSRDADTFAREFAGNHRFVHDYLLDEVVLRQSKEIQSFLLDTCVLDRLTGDLCDALTHASGGQQMLDHLERAGLFTVALDQERRWYRYHHLFADALRARLDLTDPRRARVLHECASDWFQQMGSIEEAVHHAIAAENYERAARLVEQSADRLWMRSEVKTLLAWLDEFPPEFVATWPALGVYRAWALFFTNRIELVEAELATIESRLPVNPVPSVQRIGTLVLSIRACVASVTGQYQRAIDLSRRALRGVDSEPVWRTVVLQSLGTALRAAGELEPAAQAFEEARDSAARHADLSGVIYSACNLGLHSTSTG